MRHPTVFPSLFAHCVGAWSAVPLQERRTHLSGMRNHASPVGLRSVLGSAAVIVVDVCGGVWKLQPVCENGNRNNKECWKA